MRRIQIFAARQVAGARRQPLCAQQNNRHPGVGKARTAVPLHIVQQPQPANNRRRVNRRPPALVVQADIPANHRNPQNAASIGHPANALLQLVVNLRPFRVAKIQAVGQGQRLRPHAGKVARNLGHHSLPAPIWIQKALPPVPVNRHGDGARRSFDTQHGGIPRARRNYSISLHLMVVLPIDPPPAGNVGRCQQTQQRGAGGRRQRYIAQPQRLPPPVFVIGSPGPPVLRRIGQRAHRHAGQQFIPVGDPYRFVSRNRPYHPTGHFPLAEHFRQDRRILRRRRQQHPFLGFRQHHFIPAHARLAPMHGGDVQINAAPAARRRFHRRAGQAGRPQILQRAHFPRSQRFQARFNQHFLQKGIADLDGRPQLLLLFRLKSAGRQPRGAVNAVPSGAGPYQQQQIAGSVSRRACQLVNPGNAYAHCVHQRVLRIGILKVNFAAHIRHANAVAIPANAVHHALQ